MNTILKVSDIVSCGRPMSPCLDASSVLPSNSFLTPAPSPSIGDGLRNSPRVDEKSVEEEESDESEVEDAAGGNEDREEGRWQVSEPSQASRERLGPQAPLSPSFAKYYKNSKVIIEQAIKVLSGENSYNRCDLDRYLLSVHEINPKIKKVRKAPPVIHNRIEERRRVQKNRLSKEDEEFYEQYCWFEERFQALRKEGVVDDPEVPGGVDKDLPEGMARWRRPGDRDHADAKPVNIATTGSTPDSHSLLANSSKGQ